MSKSKRQKRLSVKCPRRLRMTRAGRLQSARTTRWVANYPGKNIVRGYHKWFGVDLLCAIAELRLLGVTVDRAYELQVRQTVDGLAAYRQRKRLKRASVDSLESATDCDGRFAYIAGYTAGGMPFGVTWEELDQNPPGEP
ncbi:MAG: hypothetical protein ACYC6N_08425 [Pirellulaceae bacterium]